MILLDDKQAEAVEARSTAEPEDQVSVILLIDSERC